MTRVIMNKPLLRLIGKGLAIIGTPIFLFFGYGVFATLTYTGEFGPLPPEVAFVPIIAALGFSMIAGGVYLLKRFEEQVPLLAKDGEPIHSGETWKKGFESELYATSCGFIVSTNLESRETAHVGYRIVHADRATCKECIAFEGKIAMRGSPLRRSY